MAESVSGEGVDKVPVVYELSQYADTEGREITRLCPVARPGEVLPVRFRGKAVLVLGEVSVPFIFEIEASSTAEAFEKYDARRDEVGSKLGEEMRAAALSARLRSPLIGDFRTEKMRRRFGGNGG